MRKFFKAVLAVTSGIASFFLVAYLLMIVSPSASFAGVVILPLLFGLIFKTSGRYGLLTYPLLIILPLFLGIGYLSYQMESVAAFIFLPAAAISVMLGSYIRSYADHTLNNKMMQVAGGYIAVCIVMMITILPDLHVLDISEEVSEPLPDENLVTLDRDTVSVTQLEGSIVVVDFWATWCGKCIQMMPELQRLDERYIDNPDVTVKAVNTSWQDSFSDVETFVSERDLKIDVLYDEGAKFTEKVEVGGVPYTAIINTEKEEILVRKHGFAPGEDYVGVMSSHIDRLLANR